MNKYTDEQKTWILNNCKGKLNKELTDEFNNFFDMNVTYIAMQGLRYRIGAKSGLDKTWAKGQIAWNKGKTGYMGANKTSFKKGRLPANYKPIGSERVLKKDGYTQVKIADPNIWKLKHRLIWEQHHGPIPKGHIVTFLNGDITDFDIENLSCIPRAINARMNKEKMYSENPEITEVNINLAKIKNKVSEIKRGKL